MESNIMTKRTNTHAAFLSNTIKIFIRQIKIHELQNFKFIWSCILGDDQQLTIKYALTIQI